MTTTTGFGAFLTRNQSAEGGVLKVVLGIFYLIMAGPVLGLFVLALSGSLRLEWSAGLSATLVDTLALVVGVGFLASAIGVSTAWLIAMYRFPGRGILAILLVLPLALPTYLAAYISVELTDYFGPVQKALRFVFSFTSRRDYYFPEIRTLPGAIIVFSLVLYPYVYLPCRMMFERQGSSIVQAARIHGSKGVKLFFRVGFPLVRPALVAGAVFALLETLNDIGAVEHFGVQSLSLTIRSIWLNRGNLPGAAQLALLALAFVFGLLMLEYFFRRHSNYTGPTRAAPMVSPVRLNGWRSWTVCCTCLIPAFLGFLVPATYLAYEAIHRVAKSGISGELAQAFKNSIVLSGISALCVATIGASIALLARVSPGRLTAFAPRMATMGYAIPGTVLVIALLPVLGIIDDGIERIGLQMVISGSPVAILLAYTIRFSGIGTAQAEAGLARLSPNMDHAARTLGARTNRLAFRVLAPNITTAIGLATLFAFVDAMKELPATLLLRPLNMETLATSLYAHASGGSFEDGALEAVLILLIGLVPVTLISRAR